MNIFRGVSPDENRQRVFGGQVAGQALVAATRPVDSSRMVHSLHAYFILGGEFAEPVRYEVDRVRNGRSFTTRRVIEPLSNRMKGCLFSSDGCTCFFEANGWSG